MKETIFTGIEKGKEISCYRTLVTDVSDRELCVRSFRNLGWEGGKVVFLK